MKTLELICTIPWIIFYIWLIRIGIFTYKNDKELEKHFGKDWLKPKKIIIDNSIKSKVCTQYQPFKLNEKEYVICNFVCDGNCQFINHKNYIIKNG